MSYNFNNISIENSMAQYGVFFNLLNNVKFTAETITLSNNYAIYTGLLGSVTSTSTSFTSSSAISSITMKLVTIKNNNIGTLNYMEDGGYFSV